MVGASTAVERRTLGSKTRESLAAYAMLAPAFVVFVWFAFWPAYRLVHYSIFQQNSTGSRERFRGFGQLANTLSSDDFMSGLWITFKFLLVSVPIGVVLGLLLAVSAHRRLKGIKFFQTVFSSTIASSAAVTSVVFFTLINPNIGYFKDVSWLSINEPGSALLAVSLATVWQSLGLTFVIVLAGLQTVPDEIIEASVLDGFGPIRRFFKITIPLISPTLIFLGVILAVRAFQTYAEIEILTNGAPAGATETLLFKIARLQSPSVLHQGAGYSIGLFFATTVIAAGQFLILNRRVHYGD